jgi:hypothetical protein
MPDSNVAGRVSILQREDHTIGNSAALSDSHDHFELLLVEGKRREHIQRRCRVVAIVALLRGRSHLGIVTYLTTCIPFIGVVLFFGGAAVTMALLINLSINWCGLLKKWEQVEGYFGHQKNLKLKFTLISILCIIFSMGKDER